MKLLLFFFVLFCTGFCFGQIPQTDPIVKQGSDALQRDALVFYNKACEFHSLGNDSLAEDQLLRAISISMTLIEAQRFLADIYVSQGRFEEALIYYNAAIDFYTDQPPHYYFQLFDLAMRFGEYSFSQHGMKHFKNKYGTIHSTEPYEANFPYTVNDYEYHTASLRLMYDYLSWKGAFQLNEEKNYCSEDFIVSGNQLIDSEVNTNAKLKKGSIKKEKKMRNFPQEIEHPMMNREGTILVFNRTQNEQSNLYFCIKEGKKWSTAVLFPAPINSSSWEGHAYLSNDGRNLYFSSDRDGSKDLFVAKINLEVNSCDTLQKLDWVNSYNDEIEPSWNEDESVFYFASNGLAGFGGFDFFQCIEFNRQDGVVAPQNPKNMKYPFNSHHDELVFDFESGEQQGFLLRKDIYGKLTFLKFKRIPADPEVNFELPILFPQSNE